MDLRTEILKEHSKRQTVRIATWIGSDKRRYRELLELVLHGEPLLTQRGAWIISTSFDLHPSLFKNWIPALLSKMQEPGVHDALKRNVVRILQFSDIPKAQLGSVASLCFDYLGAPETPVAIRANAMTVLLRITEREPDLKRELRTAIELMLPYGGPAIQSRARIVTKKLDTDLSMKSVRSSPGRKKTS